MKYFISELKYKMNDVLASNIPFDEKAEGDLRQNGVAVIENFLTPEECKKLRDEMDVMCEKDYVWRDEHNSDIRVFGPENVNVLFKNLFDNKGLFNIFKKYIDKNNLHQFIMANRVSFSENNKGSGGGWHRDSINRRQLKFIMYLSDVDEKNGCFQYVSKSHTIKNKFKYNRILGLKLSDYRYSENDIEKLKQKLGIEIIDNKAKAGTLLIVDTSGLHRGKPILEGRRYAATNYMFETTIPSHIQKLILK